LKTVSNPTETALAERQVDQKQLIKRIIELTPRYIVTDYTRFKYLLAHANPNAKLITRLWKILENHPELYKSVCKYIRRYEQLPRVPAAKVVAILQQNPLYHSIRSEFISAVDGRLPPAEDKALAKLLRKMWSPRSDHPDLLARSAAFLIRTGKLTAGQNRTHLYTCAILVDTRNADQQP